MKKTLILFLLILCIISISACSNNTSNSTGTTDTQTEDTTKTQTDQTKDNTSSTQQTDQSLVGDWKYTGTIDGKNYEIDLDLENDSEFDLTIDEENREDIEDSEATGTYVIDGSVIRLSIITVQDASSYFTGTVVQNGQVELDYTLKDNSLTLNNAADSIAILPGEITLTRS